MKSISWESLFNYNFFIVAKKIQGQSRLSPDRMGPHSKHPASLALLPSRASSHTCSNPASTKSWCRQKAGADAEESPYCYARQSRQLLTSPRPHWRSPMSPWWCCSLRMQSPSVALPLAAPLLWVDFLTYCTCLLYPPAMLKTWQILAPTKYLRLPKIHWFSPNYSSLYICSQASFQKVVKTKSDHHHSPISVFILMTSELEAVLEIHWCGL